MKPVPADGLNTNAFNALYRALAPLYPPFAIQLKVEGAHALALPAVRTALAQAVRANQLPTPPTPTISVAGPVELFKRLPLSSDAAPLELILGTDGLLFRCAHHLMDAEGLLHFAKDFFRALRYLACVGSTSRPVQLSEGLSPDVPSWPQSAAPFNRCGQGTGHTHQTLALPGQFTAPGAAIISALAAHCSGPARFMVPTDLRQTSKAPPSTANGSNALYLPVPAGANTADVRALVIKALAQGGHRRLSRAQRRTLALPSAVLRLGSRVAQRTMQQTNRWLASALVSNVGPVALSDLSGGGFTATWASLLPFDMPGVALSVITLQHSAGLAVALSAPGPASLNAHAEAIAAALAPQRQEPPRNLWDAIERTIEQHAGRVALIEGDTALTYEALGRQVQGLSAALAARGVQPAARVLIGSGRSADTLIAMLACLRLGATFVPTDPEWPRDRLQFIEADCEAHLCLGGPTGCTIRALIEEGLPLTPPPVQPARVVYILYTSGSTGQPKGVVVGGHSLARYIDWARTEYLKGRPETFAFCTSPAFDLTLTTLFAPLTTGGAVKVFTGAALETAALMAQDTDITALKITPAHLKLLLTVGGLPPAVRLFIVGGEALTTALAKQLGPEAVVYNEYGPTEATVGCVVHKFDPTQDSALVDVPIGQPIPGTTLHIDYAGEAESPDAYGELILSGESLALGYLKAAQEEGKFITLASGVRGYKTGDCVRWGARGLEYGGRADRQVKIGGRRVELGEIEAVAESSGFCRTFIAYTEESAAGVVLKARADMQDPQQLGQLKAFLAHRLPGHMVPRDISTGSAELTANLKVSRPCAAQASTAASPASETSNRMSALRELVRVVSEGQVAFIPAQENLTQAGLDSLQILSLVLLTEKTLGVTLDETRLTKFAVRPTLETLMNSFIE